MTLIGQIAFMNYIGMANHSSFYSWISCRAETSDFLNSLFASLFSATEGNLLQMQNGYPSG